MRTHVDTVTLQMALIGYQSQLAQINAKMEELRRRLRGTRVSGGGHDVLGSFLRKGVMSAAGRKRIAEAQRKRWAAFHKGAGAKRRPAKHTLSPEAKAKRAANLPKARAAKPAK